MKQAVFRFPRQGLFTRWMSSYAFILAIPLVTSMLVYFQSGNIIRNEINRANIALLKQVQQAMDSRLQETERLGMQIAMHPQLKGIMHATELNTNARTSLAQLLKDFAVYQTVNSFIYDFYVYFPNTEIVVTSTAMYDSPALFFELSGKLLGELSYPEWTELMQRKQFREYLLFEHRGVAEEKRKVIAAAYSLPMEDPYRVSAKMMILLDEQVFRQEVEQAQWVNQGTVFIMDDQNQVLASSSELASASALSLSRPEHIENMEIDGGQVTVAYVSSEVSNWKYGVMLPSSIYLEKAQYIRNLTLISLTVCLIGGIVIAYYFSRKNYYPVHELMQILSPKGKASLAEAKNEYEFIKGVVSRTLDEQEQINRRLEQQSSALRANFVQRLMKGRLERSFPVEEALTTYSLTFYSDNFAVLLFYIEDYSGLFRDSTLQDSEEKLNFVHLIIRNIVEELVNQQHNGLVEEVDGMMACLINFKQEAPELERLAGDILEKARNYIQNRFHIQFTASVSRVHVGIAGIAAAYQEAVEAMEYKLVMGSSQIIYYEQVAAVPETYTFYYPIELEQQLINFMKAGQWERAEGALQDIFARNFSGGPISIDLAKCLMFAMIGTMLKTLEDIPSSDKAFIDELQPVSRLFACDSVPAMKVVMLDILQQVCRYMEINKKSHNSGLRDMVLEYISEHYQDMNLSVSSIAAHFNVHANYLSNFFKEQTGESMLDAINKTRLVQAKKLLGQGWSIGDTAVHSGFYNSNAFIRVFKKYEGITPGQYKSML